MYDVRVYHEDTDSGGVVYYANYLKFLERARTQLLLNNNYTNTLIKEKFDIIFIVKSCNINFIYPAKLDDNLSISTYVIKKSKVQVFLDQKIYCENILIVEAKVRLASINNEGKVSRMPLDLFKLF